MSYFYFGFSKSSIADFAFRLLYNSDKPFYAWYILLNRRFITFVQSLNLDFQLMMNFLFQNEHRDVRSRQSSTIFKLIADLIICNSNRYEWRRLQNTNISQLHQIKSFFHSDRISTWNAAQHARVYFNYRLFNGLKIIAFQRYIQPQCREHENFYNIVHVEEFHSLKHNGVDFYTNFQIAYRNNNFQWRFYTDKTIK